MHYCGAVHGAPVRCTVYQYSAPNNIVQEKVYNQHTLNSHTQSRLYKALFGLSCTFLRSDLNYLIPEGVSLHNLCFIPVPNKLFGLFRVQQVAQDF